MSLHLFEIFETDEAFVTAQLIWIRVMPLHLFETYETFVTVN